MRQCDYIRNNSFPIQAGEKKVLRYIYCVVLSGHRLDVSTLLRQFKMRINLGVDLATKGL